MIPKVVTSKAAILLELMGAGKAYVWNRFRRSSKGIEHEKNIAYKHKEELYVEDGDELWILLYNYDLNEGECDLNESAQLWKHECCAWSCAHKFMVCLTACSFVLNPSADYPY